MIHTAFLVTGHYGGPEKVILRISDYYIQSTGSPNHLHSIADWECIDDTFHPLVNMQEFLRSYN